MHTPVYDDSGRVVRTVVEREPQFDAEQRELLAALVDYESTVNEYGIPVDEATSVEADPGNPKGTYTYKARTRIDWSAMAAHDVMKPYEKNDPYRGARRIIVERVERSTSS